jgi:hypothetical protein
MAKVIAITPAAADQLAIPTLALVLNMIAIEIGATAVAISSIPVLVLSLSLGILAAVATSLHFTRLPATQGLTNLRTIAYIDLGLSFVSVGGSAVALGIDFV